MDWRRVLRIARWEATSGAVDLDRKTVVAIAAIVVALIPVTAFLASGVSTDSGLYRAGVSQDSPYTPAITSSDVFVLGPADGEALRRGEVDLMVTDTVEARSTDKGRAALQAFRDVVRSYNARLMSRESNESAAFPVRVNLLYMERDLRAVVGGGGAADGTGPGGDGGENATSPDGEGEGGENATPSDGEGDRGALDGALGGEQTGLDTPDAIRPPFPFRSLILAFAFVVPMNFVVQVYASSIMDERIGRKGEMLLVSPASRGEIVAGKTLPYLAATVGTAAVIAAAIGGGPLSVAAMLPVALAFISFSFVAGLLARSFKELTFVMVAVSVFLTTYLFVPAVFADIHPVAAISPVTLVVQDLRGAAVPLGDYVFSTLPLYLASGVLFALGTAVYREEDLFTQKPLHGKAMDALQGQMHGRLSVAKLSVLFIPFVFATELLGIAALFALPRAWALPVLLAFVAVVEELFKSVHVYTAVSRRLFDDSRRTALTLGALSGAGFFVGEKLTLISGIVGLNVRVDLGRAVFASLETPLALLLVAPLALHVVTASISALGARRGPRGYALGLFAAILIHFAYNLSVVSLVG